MLSSELVNLKVYDWVMLKNGNTVCISKVIVPGEKYLYWDEPGMDPTDEVPPQRTVTAEKIDHVVRQASAPSVCSSDGCRWIVGDIAEEGMAYPYGIGRGYRVSGRLFREAASIDPGLFGGAPWRELFLKAFHSEHPTYDPWEIARSHVREWERSNTAYEKRERDFIHDVPGVTECLRVIDTADRRAMLEMRRAFNTQKGDVITDERGRRLLVVTAPSDISPTTGLISVIEINERMEAVKPMAPDLVHVIDVVSVIQRGAMSREEVARFTTETIVAYVLRKTPPCCMNPMRKSLLSSQHGFGVLSRTLSRILPSGEGGRKALARRCSQPVPNSTCIRDSMRMASECSCSVSRGTGGVCEECLSLALT